MRRLLLLALSMSLPTWALPVAAQHAVPAMENPPACLDFEGSAQIAGMAGVVFFGEHHGTRQIPALFGAVVCHAGKQRRRVHVAFEQPETWTAPLNAYVDSTDPAGALSAFLSATRWRDSALDSPDGRTSEGFIELLAYLRDLKRAGYALSLSAFDTRPWEYDKTHTDIGMAAALTRQIEGAGADLTLVLSGEYHTRLLENTTPAKPQPMAFLVGAARPPWKLLGINVTYSAGAFWGCSATRCGEIRQPVDIPAGPPALKIDAVPDKNGYRGTLYVGPISPSRPYLPREN